MSRLIIKNLPAYITTERLQQHFTQAKAPPGTITDVKVAHKRDGASRRFGFVGYKTTDEAANAQAWFDKTFIDSARVRVEVMDGAKDAPALLPNKRLRLDVQVEPCSSSTVSPSKKAEESTRVGDLKKSRKDVQFDTFMEVMQPKPRTGPAWANDEASRTKYAQSKKGKAPAQTEDILADDQLVEGLSDLEWMQRRMKQIVGTTGEEKAFMQDEERGTAPTMSASGGKDLSFTEPTDASRDAILQTGRLFVRNLAFSCTEEELRELFSVYGDISQIHIPIDPATKQSKGLAYVKFDQTSAALAAYEALDKRSFQGRLLHIIGAVDRKDKLVIESEGGKKNSLKSGRSAKRKAGAGKEFNWSMLYMNSDAVISSVADRMNISKSDILDPESSNAAVKLALAETHVIQETKTYLESQGVVLSSFAGRARSETIILIKNIPYGTSAGQLRDMFGTHGVLARVLVPPAGTMAVVEFVHVDEARSAFHALAYRRLGNSVIYLEKGPLGMFQEATPGEPAIIDGRNEKPVTVDDADDSEPDVSAGTTLFIKNLSFATTTERLLQVFGNLPSFSFAHVQTKPDPKHPGARLSMGYGFVGFKTADAAKHAIKSMQGHVLDGHALTVKLAGRGAEKKEKKEDRASTTKMIVKNLPFEATRKDVRELFGAHGQLKSARVPKRFDRRTRGFAFLEFVSRHEAENAYNALKHTHLLGRHLVLEWANDNDVDVEELRKRVGVELSGGSELPGRKRKLVLDNEDEEILDD
ncbi:hypothetical protein K488DRAFT_43140 [Vararia minispora EC-137]|uniref:Uncharacterized protein n=1 Tax=Vararia minispora EC-137 TaxID=1314806 RepID=A0ACB8QVH9_9AGAM|nr:hypothetical protein K488DRAFT_43140 [Vararia minispora EC-137]